MAAKKIIVASSKGGVGKTTVALGVANALCSLGKKVLLCDLDFENRCLDLFMGIEDAALFNVADLAKDRVTPEKAILKNSAGLSFLAAPEGVIPGGRSGNDISKDDLARALKDAADSAKYDFVIFDTGTGHDIPALLADTFRGATALVVASHQASSARGAERTASVLEEHGVKDCRLVICGFEFYEAVKGERSGVIDIIDSSKVPLIGVVPLDRALLLSNERGVKAPADCDASVAFINIACRLCGQTVRLFDGIGIKRRKII